MGEKKRLNTLRQFYLKLDYKNADTKTIKEAESFFSDDTGEDVYIIAEQNKICMDQLISEDQYVRYVYHREHEFWYGDYDDVSREYNLTPYGDLFIEFLKENHKNLFDFLVLNGCHMEMAEERNLLAIDKIFELKAELLVKNPYPSNNNLEMAQHLRMLESMAKELVLNDYVLVKPFIKVFENYEKIRENPF